MFCSCQIKVDIPLCQLCRLKSIYSEGGGRRGRGHNYNMRKIRSLRGKYMLFAGWEVRIVKNCDRGLENAARGRWPRAAFSRPRSQFFTIRTDPKPVNNFFFFFFFAYKKLFQFL